ncbi:DUF2878 domain-containing protein [Erwinia billingiae]|jgi:hypothetical protein|uniref:DUF2878 domain-containing protein n=1 Tax=Erwinia billingiae TaxID=182337 RepID=UPI0032092244
MSTLRFWLLTLGFDLYWALAVGLRERAVYALVVIALLAWWASDAALRLRVLAVALVGLAMDSLWLWLDLFHFADAQWVPLWMLSLWLAYACWWPLCLHRYALSGPLLAVLGAVVGPFTYYLGERLGGMELTASPLKVFGLMAIGWAIYLPLTRRLLQRSER